MIGYGGFGMANAMFTIVPIFIGVVFVLILAGIAVQAVRGAAQWKRNNDAPVLTVEAEVAAKLHGRAAPTATGGLSTAGDMPPAGPITTPLFRWRAGTGWSGSARHGVRPSGGGGPGAADLPGHPLSGVPPHMSGETE